MSASLGSLQLADWRRRVFGLYAGVRQLSVHDPAAGHELWKSARDELFAGHPVNLGVALYSVIPNESEVSSRPRR